MPNVQILEKANSEDVIQIELPTPSARSLLAVLTGDSDSDVDFTNWEGTVQCLVHELRLALSPYSPMLSAYEKGKTNER